MKNLFENKFGKIFKIWFDRIGKIFKKISLRHHYYEGSFLKEEIIYYITLKRELNFISLKTIQHS